MSRPRFPLVILLPTLLGLAGAAPAAPPAAAGRPNILLIMSDDMGFSDIGCYGGEIATPNLDALAAGGVRFTQFYNNARCCPTRASLMTGLYPHQAGVGHMMNDRGHDGYRGVLNRQSVTIAEALRPAGYRNYMVGKWHLTRFAGPNGDRATWPLGRGFEKYYGIIGGASNYFDPGSLCRQDKLISSAADPDYRPDSYYFTDAISDNAVHYLRDHQSESPDKPFFLYVAYTAAHWPIQAPEAAVAKYRGKFDGGYARYRESRLRKMIELGLVPPGTPLSAQAGDWSSVADPVREARCMEVYAAMVDVMDQGIGRIVAQLRADARLDNTLILFLQDNGGCAETVGRQKDNAQDAPPDLKPMPPGQVQPKSQPPMQTRDGRWVRTGPTVLPGPADTYLAYGEGWANVSNTPFREYKHWTHEGGISTPLVAHWPAGIAPARAGQLERQPSHLVDVMATCVDLAGATYPAEVAGATIKPMAGVSLRPALAGGPLARTTPLFWEHEGNRAVRDGRWKLVAKADRPWELYDIEADRTEQHDLAGSEVDRARAMAAAWDAWAARSDVLPLGTWDAERGTTARNFRLKPDDHLERAEAPQVAGRAFALDARFEAGAGHPDGVIVAHGGTAQGYVLFLEGGRPHFLVRAGGTSHEVVGTPLAPGVHSVRATLAAEGTLALEVDGRPAAKPVAGRLLAKMPADGLDVGRDGGAPVGPYDSPSPFGGRIESIGIEVGTP